MMIESTAAGSGIARCLVAELVDATALELIDRIDEPSGASVRMYSGVYALPIGAGKYFRVAPSACLHLGCHPGRCGYRASR